MNQTKKIIIISIITFIVIAIFHYFALKNYWYWTYRWLDIPVHIAGGFCVSLVVLWICFISKQIDKIQKRKINILLLMLISVLFATIFWKISELFLKISSLHNIGYWQNTSRDFLSGFIGSAIAFVYFIRK